MLVRGAVTTRRFGIGPALSLLTVMHQDTARARPRRPRKVLYANAISAPRRSSFGRVRASEPSATNVLQLDRRMARGGRGTLRRVVPDRSARRQRVVEEREPRVLPDVRHYGSTHSPCAYDAAKTPLTRVTPRSQSPERHDRLVADPRRIETKQPANTTHAQWSGADPSTRPWRSPSKKAFTRMPGKVPKDDPRLNALLRRRSSGARPSRKGPPSTTRGSVDCAARTVRALHHSRAGRDARSRRCR